MSPALAGRFSTTAPPGKPQKGSILDGGMKETQQSLRLSRQWIDEGKLSWLSFEARAGQSTSRGQILALRVSRFSLPSFFSCFIQSSFIKHLQSVTDCGPGAGELKNE